MYLKRSLITSRNGGRFGGGCTLWHPELTSLSLQCVQKGVRLRATAPTPPYLLQFEIGGDLVREQPELIELFFPARHQRATLLRLMKALVASVETDANVEL